MCCGCGASWPEFFYPTPEAMSTLFGSPDLPIHAFDDAVAARFVSCVPHHLLVLSHDAIRYRRRLFNIEVNRRPGQRGAIFFIYVQYLLF